MSQTITRPVGEVFATAVSLDEFPRWSPCINEPTPPHDEWFVPSSADNGQTVAAAARSG